MYCGIGPIPKGKQRGTPEYCLNKKQVRYWGIKKIDKQILEALEQVNYELLLQKEKFKLLKLTGNAKILIKDIKNTQLEIDIARTDKKANQLNKQLDKLLIKRDKLVKNIKKQKEIVEILEIEAEL